MKDLSPIVESLAQSGIFIGTQFFSEAEVAEFKDDIKRLESEGALRIAGVGRGEALALASEIRKDRTLWLELSSPTNEPQKKLALFIDELRAKLNQELFLGLWSFEGHYAHYEVGSFYKRHSDVFKTSDARKVSLILYLNESDWREDDGGQLRVYLPTSGGEEAVIDVTPRAGTLVCFMSSGTEHEVLTANRDRYSFTGWFRTRF